MPAPKNSPAAKHAQPAVAHNTGSSGSAPSLRNNADAAAFVPQGPMHLPANVRCHMVSAAINPTTFTISLPEDVSRCMALGQKYGETCPKAQECARYVAVRYDSIKTLQRVSVHNRACSDDNYLMHIPLAGLPRLGDRT